MSVRPKENKGKKNKLQYGLHVIGVTRIFSREVKVKAKQGREAYSFDEYTVTISRKNEDGSYKNLYVPCYFEKNLDKPENNSIILIQESNLFVTGNKGYEKISLYIRQWDYQEDGF